MLTIGVLSFERKRQTLVKNLSKKDKSHSYQQVFYRKGDQKFPKVPRKKDVVESFF